MTDITSEYQEQPAATTFEEAVGKYPNLKARVTEADNNLKRIEANLFINFSVLAAFGTPEFVDLWKVESERVLAANERLIAAKEEYRLADKALTDLVSEFSK